MKKFNENWNKDTEVIGIPSGQIIYMTTEEINYFKNKKLIRFVMWDKPKIGYHC